MAAVILDEFNPNGDNIVVIPTGGGEEPPHFEGLTNPTINQGTEFDPTDGVRALDKDGNEVPYTVSPEEIDTCEKGNHTLTYTAGETTATRIVTVQTIADPTISGATPISVQVGEEFDPLDGVSAVDGNGNDIEVKYGLTYYNRLGNAGFTYIYEKVGSQYTPIEGATVECEGETYTTNAYGAVPNAIIGGKVAVITIDGKTSGEVTLANNSTPEPFVCY